MSEDGYSYKTGYEPDYDLAGVSREEAAAKGWHYIPGTDDEGNDMGVYVRYDSNAFVVDIWSTNKIIANALPPLPNRDNNE